MPTSPKLFSSYSHSRRFANLRRFIPLFCFLFGLAGFLFGSISFFSANPRTPKCAGSNPLSVSVSWNLNAQSGDGVLGAKERHKVMGFVGIQTGFASARRRKALRSTWFPSDHQGLLRFFRYWICLKFFYPILKHLYFHLRFSNYLAKYDVILRFHFSFSQIRRVNRTDL